MATTTPARAFSPRQVAEALDVHEATIRAEVRRGKLRAVRVGRLLRISDTALAAYLTREHREQVAKVR